MVESFVERMRRQAMAAPKGTVVAKEEKAAVHITTCPDCGAPRAEADGVGDCRYCGHVFVSALASDYARKEPHQP